MSARLAWSLWALTVACLVAALLLPTAGSDDEIGPLVATLLFAFSFATVGALVASRRRDNPLGWIMCLAGLAYALGGLSVTFVESTLAETDDDLLTGAADWVSAWVWMLGIGPVITFLLLLFPTGRLPSRRWRPVAITAGAANAVVILAIALEGVPGVEAVGIAASFVLAAAALASVASLVVRFRRAHGLERRQLKWLTYAAAVAGAVLAVVVVADSVATLDSDLSNTVVSIALALAPITMGIAILRHGLFDIDVVINRTLVYAALTGTLLASYLGTVLLLQLALSPLTEDSDLAIAGSTLAVAALFRPARARIQAIVDRRFYRRRYDAQRTLEGFGARLRDEVDLDALGSDLRRVVAETMQPAHVSLWVRGAAR